LRQRVQQHVAHKQGVSRGMVRDRYRRHLREVAL
jgi:hypothetical protein